MNEGKKLTTPPFNTESTPRRNPVSIGQRRFLFPTQNCPLFLSPAAREVR